MIIRKFSAFIILFICLLFSIRTQANHIIGGEVRYEHISGNTYRIVLNLYGDCDLSPGSTFGTLATLQPVIQVYRDSTTQVSSITLARTTTPPQDASPTCPAYMNSTRCNGGTEIGIKIYEYDAILTLPAANPYSACWRFVMDGDLVDASGNTRAGRSTAIDNLQAGSVIYIYSTLNNLGGNANSTPAFSTIATPYFCITGNQTFNPGATDANNDVLTYTLVSALQSGNAPAAYNPGYPAPYRLATNGTPTFNAQTGQLDFRPSQQQRSVVVYLVEEYRNGVRVGSAMREMTLVVIPCNNTAPMATISGLSGGILLSNTSVAVCRGQTVSFGLNPASAPNDTIDITSSGIPTGATYFISNNGTPNPTSSFSWNTSFAAAGTYNFYITYADRACPIAARQTISYSVVVAPDPQFSFTMINPAGCNRKGVFQITTATGARPAITIRQGATTVKSYPASATATPITDSLVPGTYRITAVSGANCSADTTVTITALNVPVIAVSQTSVSCFGRQDGSATATVTGGIPPFTYSWNTTPAQSTPTATGLRAGTYTVTVTDQAGCVQGASVTVGQPDSLRVQVSVEDVRCFGQANGTATALVTGGTLPYAYSWNTIPVQTGAMLSGLAPGRYAVSVVDANGCTAQASDSVRTPQILQINAAVVAHNRCFGTAEGVATVSTTGGVLPYSYLWNANPPQNTSTATGLPAGTFRILVTDANGCTATDSVVINQGIAIVATITVTDTPCANDASGRAYVQASGGAGGPYTYRWSRGIAAGDTVSGLSPGTLLVTVTDNDNCHQDFNAVVPARPTPEINAGPDRVLCDGDSALLATSGTAINWQWAPADDLSCTNCPAPVTTTRVDRVYTVSSYFNNGCRAADTVFVQVLHPGTQSRTGRDTAICAGDTAQLFATGGVAYQWSPAETLTNDSIANPRAFPDTTTRYTVIIHPNQCFADTLTQTVAVVSRPTVSLGPDFTALSGATTVLEATAPGAISITWTPVIGLSCADCFSPTATLMQSITYVATVRNSLGCAASDTVRIQVSCDGGSYYIANTFTPNGDGVDDWFYPQGKGAGRILRFDVYNRWGEKVFGAANLRPNYPQAGWNGTYADQPVSPGVFTYIMEAQCADGTPVYLKGDVTLIR